MQEEEHERWYAGDERHDSEKKTLFLVGREERQRRDSHAGIDHQRTASREATRRDDLDMQILIIFRKV